MQSKYTIYEFSYRYSLSNSMYCIDYIHIEISTFKYFLARTILNN